jgi:hypothetical protein
MRVERSTAAGCVCKEEILYGTDLIEVLLLFSSRLAAQVWWFQFN